MDAADQGSCPTPHKTQDAPNKKDPRVTSVGSSRLLFPVYHSNLLPVSPFLCLPFCSGKEPGHDTSSPDSGVCQAASEPL